ncbi:MAG TPA: hypothetical protein VII44_03425 [Puia sp.]
MKYLQIEPLYVVSIKEILWGGILVAITMGIHGFGMLTVLRVNYAVKHWLKTKKSLMSGLMPVIFASCMILIVHLFEVMVWGLFFLWKGCFSNNSLSIYFALNEYTTVGSKFNLPLQWRLLEGMISITGLLTFAWSTGVLFTLAKEFQDPWIESYKRHRQKESPK